MKSGVSKSLRREYRSSAAQARTAWEADYGGAIEATLEGDASRFIDLLRARRPLTDEDYERLADYIELTTRSRGAASKEAAQEAARLARTLLDLAGRPGQPARDKFIAAACESAQRTTGGHVGTDEVKDLLRRIRSRRQ